MKKYAVVISVVTAGALVLSLGTAAQKFKLVPQRIKPSAYDWSKSVENQSGSGMQPGIKTLFIAGGDGTTHDLYSLLFKIAPHTAIQPHSHGDDRSCFVLSGIWYFAYGSPRDEAKLQALPPGSSYTEPANQVHFAGTKDQEVLLECTGVGPTSSKFVNPVDDPRNNH